MYPNRSQPDQPHAPGTCNRPGSWYQRRLAAFVADDGDRRGTARTPGYVSNTEAFGKNSHRDRPGPFPQARVDGLGECGTRAVIAARIGPLAVGERELTEQLLSRFEPGMLVMADRGFYSLALWG